MTPLQKRWKWVKFESLPEDMKLYVRPPKVEKLRDDAGKDKDKKKKVEVVEIKE